MKTELEYLKESFSILSTHELREIIKRRSKDYTPSALKVAKEELRKREKNNEHYHSFENYDQEEDKLDTNWLRYYTFVRLPLSILIMVLSALKTGNLLIITISVAVSILPLLVVIGIFMRKLWGWRLNWVLLFLDIIIYPIGSGNIDINIFISALIVRILTWGLPNYIYFKKRRVLFK